MNVVKGCSLFLLTCLVVPAASFVSRSSYLHHQRSCKPLFSNNRIESSHLDGQVTIRDWQEGDGQNILQLLEFAQENDDEEQPLFNPEGSLNLDCQSEGLLKESYDPEDGGCFVVAEWVDQKDNNSRVLVGTAGLIVGTAIQYQTSGASQSSGDITAAIRRCCCRLPTIVSSDDVALRWNGVHILKKMVTLLEERAALSKTTQVIALAYPASTNKNDQATTMKPSPQLLEDLGYQRLPQQLPGVNVLQYGKVLKSKTVTSNMVSDGAVGQPQSIESLNTSRNSVSSSLVSSAIVISFLGVIFASLLGVAHFVGMDTSLQLSSKATESINRGLGRPLSQEDFRQLLQDEQLKRTTLDDDDTSNNESSREWKDLSLEEQREELALLQVINGQDIRIK